MKEIELTRGYVALVDDADFEWINKWRWHADVNRSTVYAARAFKTDTGKRVTIRMHRAIMGVTDPKVFVDHKFGNGLDNQRENLRTCTNAQNLLNRGSDKDSSSRFKGVYWHKTGKKGAAGIKASGKMEHIGLFENEEDAARHFNQWAKIHHGEFAKYNDVSPMFPDQEWKPRVIIETNRSGFRGVSFNNKKMVWIAQIYIRGKQTYINAFPDPIEAAKAYDSKAIEVFGGSARLNFPITNLNSKL